MLNQYIDLTRLKAQDTQEAMCDFLKKAAQCPKLAAVCIYPDYLALAKTQLQGTGIKCCTVVNFPNGDTPIDAVLMQIYSVKQQGVDEIDIVFPYRAYLNGKTSLCQDFIEECRLACPSPIVFKVILETCAFDSPSLLRQVCKDVLEANVDFLKTSTGKSTHGATLDAAQILLESIRDSKKATGFKASGGIKTAEQAMAYLDLAKSVFGNEWPQPHNFRIGCSRFDVCDA